MYEQYLNELEETICNLSSDELKEFLNDDEKVEEKIDQVLDILKAEKNSLFEENRNKAEQNIEKEPEVLEMRGRVTDLLEEGKKTCQSVQEKLSEIKEKSGNVSQDTALALLQAAAAQSEEETDEIYNKFKENEINVEQFLEEFLTARKTMHLRKLKADKMQELIRRQANQPGQRSSFSGGYPGPAYSNLPNSGFFPKAPYPTPGSAPYPFAGPMMPMPPPRPY